MRAIEIALPVALTAVAAFGAYATYPGNDTFAGALRQTSLLAGQPEPQLDATLNTMIASAEVDPGGNLWFVHPLGEPHYLEPDSGHYWQISGQGHEDFRSRSLGERKLALNGRRAWNEGHHYDSNQFADEPLRVAERTVRLPGSDVAWQFAVARSID